MMPSLTAIVCCALLFIVLGLMWLLGCSFFERKAPSYWCISALLLW